MESAEACDTSRSPLREPAPFKSLMDLLVASIILPVALAVMAVAALMIKIEDGGPIFYRRRVVGRNGEFDALKLRTMRVGADEILHRNRRLAAEFTRNFKLKNDPRVTRTGRLLRRWSIDELPQIFNVLRCEMALVGPRMVTAPELEKYGAWSRIFSIFKPGLTGYWQVNGRQEVDYAKRVRMDIFYVQNWSLSFDLKILIRTVWKVLKREGAY
ncbi:MAG: sugar transferase [Terriglobia bacterium]